MHGLILLGVSSYGIGNSHLLENVITVGPMGCGINGADTCSEPSCLEKLQEYRSGHSSDYVFPGSKPSEYIWRSALGLVSVYNLLPPDVVLGSATVSIFQAKLQDLTKSRARQGASDWPNLLSTRWNLLHHPLVNLRMSNESAGSTSSVRQVLQT